MVLILINKLGKIGFICFIFFTFSFLHLKATFPFINQEIPVEPNSAQHQIIPLNGDNATTYEIFNSFTVSDVDKDGIKEVILAGYKNVSSTLNACLYIYNVSDGAFQLEAGISWNEGYNTSLVTVITEDLDYDGSIEIITAGFYNSTPLTACIWIWNVTYGNLVLENKKYWQNGNTYPQSLASTDLDRDGKRELIVLFWQQFGQMLIS